MKSFKQHLKERALSPEVSDDVKTALDMFEKEMKREFPRAIINTNISFSLGNALLAEIYFTTKNNRLDKINAPHLRFYMDLDTRRFSFENIAFNSLLIDIKYRKISDSSVSGAMKKLIKFVKSKKSIISSISK